MNEAIGVKGGKRDRKRRIIITANQKKKIKENYKRKKQERIKKLEKIDLKILGLFFHTFTCFVSILLA